MFTSQKLLLKLKIAQLSRKDIYDILLAAKVFMKRHWEKF